MLSGLPKNQHKLPNLPQVSRGSRSFRGDYRLASAGSAYASPVCGLEGTNHVQRLHGEERGEPKLHRHEVPPLQVL